MKFKMSDARTGLDKADKALNKGVTGWLTKSFMGKEFTNTMNETLAEGKSQLDLVERHAALKMSGNEYSATLLSIADTGGMVNYDPIVQVQLSATPQVGASFTIDATTIVSKISVPRVGDMFRIRFNPSEPDVVVII